MNYYRNSGSSNYRHLLLLPKVAKQLKRQHKACAGCDSHFTTFRNYDYCANCAINGSRYIPRKGKCPECGDGSG